MPRAMGRRGPPSPVEGTSGLCIAAAQTIPVRGDVRANLEQHVRLVRLAAGWPVQVVVFPELSLTGYELDRAADLAFVEGDPRLAPLLAAASSFRTTLVAGAPVRIDSRLHIGAFIVSPDRTVEIYTKRRLGAFSSTARADGVPPAPEAAIFQPGSRDPLVRLANATAAVAVCADAGRPSHPQAAARRGAEVYLASMFVIPSEMEKETANLVASAVRYGMTVAFANYGGPSGGLASGGGSAIWTESGDLLAQIDGLGAGVVVASESEAGWRAEAIMLDAS